MEPQGCVYFENGASGVNLMKHKLWLAHWNESLFSLAYFWTYGLNTKIIVKN